MEHKEGEGIMISPRSILRMRVESAEVCWNDVRFEAKAQTNSVFASWAFTLMANPMFLKKISQIGIRKLESVESLAINGSPEDVEFLISKWSTKSHTFIAA